MATSASRPRRQNWDSNEQYQELIRMYDLVTRLQDEIIALKAGRSAAVSTGPRGLESSVAIPAVADPNATAQVYPSGINPNLTLASVAGGTTGYQFTNTGGVATMAVSSAATARGGIGAAAAGTPGAHTITLAKITGAGANGSITWNADGVVTAYVDPT